MLFTFPSRYWSTIGHRGVFSLRRWSSQIPMKFHVLHGTQVRRQGRYILFAYGTITLYGATFPGDLRLKIYLVTSRLSGITARQRLTTLICQRIPAYSSISLGSYHFAHHYSGNRFYFLLLGVIRWFSSPRSPPYPMNSDKDFPTKRDGLSHSEISGSMCVCHYPKLIAACHVLLRHPMPRHPPCTLIILIQIFLFSTKLRLIFQNVLHQQNMSKNSIFHALKTQQRNPCRCYFFQPRFNSSFF